MDGAIQFSRTGTGFLSMVTRPLLGEQLRKRAEMDDA